MNKSIPKEKIQKFLSWIDCSTVIVCISVVIPPQFDSLWCPPLVHSQDFPQLSVRQVPVWGKSVRNMPSKMIQQLTWSQFDREKQSEEQVVCIRLKNQKYFLCCVFEMDAGGTLKNSEKKALMGLYLHLASVITGCCMQFVKRGFFS